ncbi:MAG: ribosomal protein S18-alanine N-acetyltransferase [Rhizobiaceae bacterium]|nr:ribosomal protein S18-alanine N-acetyltransferase [Rhizobiaceae bacterium]MCV0405783.1 ribosomal protein S18-alanine N-acetyltransferase [Rhizobiaceae bacterium]
MRLFYPRGSDHEVTRLVRSDAAAVATLHREDFARPWTTTEFDELLRQNTVFGFAARVIGQPKAPLAGFVLARLAADEAEVLTIAVARAARRLGLGRALMEALLRRLHALRAETLFLEVDETNDPAVHLYRRLGFVEVARRPGYYGGGSEGKSDALVMRLDLGKAPVSR